MVIVTVITWQKRHWILKCCVPKVGPNDNLTNSPESRLILHQTGQSHGSASEILSPLPRSSWNFGHTSSLCQTSVHVPLLSWKATKSPHQIPLAGWHISDSLLCVHRCAPRAVGHSGCEWEESDSRSLASCVSCAKKNHYPIQPSAQQLSNPLTYWDSTLTITYKYVVNLQFGYTDCTPEPNSGPGIISFSLRHFDYKTTQLDSFSIHIVLCILN